MKVRLFLPSLRPTLKGPGERGSSTTIVNVNRSIDPSSNVTDCSYGLFILPLSLFPAFFFNLGI